MPVITVAGPHITTEQKRAMAQGLSEVAARVYGRPVEHIIVMIRENDPENVSIGGRLVADRAVPTEWPHASPDSSTRPSGA